MSLEGAQQPSHLRRRAINPGSVDDPDEVDTPVIAALYKKPAKDVLPPIVSLQRSGSDIVPFISALQKSGENISPLLITLNKFGEDVSPIISTLHTSGVDVLPYLFALYKSGVDVSPFLGTLRESGRDISDISAAVREFQNKLALATLNSPDLDNVQGDICFTFPKRWEGFLFFKIQENKVKEFRQKLLVFAPRITSAAQTREDINKNVTLGEVISTGIAFAKAGLKVLGETQNLQDPHFDAGSQRLEKDALGDKCQWEEVFDIPGNTHAVILVATQFEATCKKEITDITSLFGESIEVLKVFDGRGRQNGEEHFGYKDGISQPALEGVTKKPWPGQRVVKPGVLIMGYPGDPHYGKRPSFTKNGSFLVFRKLEQNVLFHEHYVKKNYTQAPLYTDTGVELTQVQRTKLFGARLFGRFKSGVPLALCPFIEDDEYACADKNNDFDYTERPAEYGCPFSAHVRKTVPRNLQPFVSKEYLDLSMIVRAGIPYGDEVSQEERDEFEKLTEDEKENLKSERGLLFVSYQTSIHNGFFRQATLFGNNDWFPLTELRPTLIGQDPIIGGPPDVHRALGKTNISKEGEVTVEVENPDDICFEVTGVAKKKTSATAFEQKYFVTSRGGEYYFVPGISTVLDWGKKIE